MWPKDAKGLVRHLNEWSKNELDALERPEAHPGWIVSGETRGWVSEHKRMLAELGARIRWDPEKQEYVLV